MLITTAITLDGAGQTALTFAGVNQLISPVSCDLVTSEKVTAKFEVDGELFDYSLNQDWSTVGAALVPVGSSFVVTFDGGAKAAGVTGTLTLRVSHA